MGSGAYGPSLVLGAEPLAFFYLFRPLPRPDSFIFSKCTSSPMSSLPCPPQHWPRFSVLLDAAMEVPEPARVDWLAGLGGPDAEFRPWLARVLGGAAASRTGSFLDGPVSAALADDGFQAGDTVGPY